MVSALLMRLHPVLPPMWRPFEPGITADLSAPDIDSVASAASASPSLAAAAAATVAALPFFTATPAAPAATLVGPVSNTADLSTLDSDLRRCDPQVQRHDDVCPATRRDAYFLSVNTVCIP
jgi:hypothetical protein